MPLGKDFPNVYGIQQAFLKNGQVDWNRLYAANTNSEQSWVCILPPVRRPER